MQSNGHPSLWGCFKEPHLPGEWAEGPELKEGRSHRAGQRAGKGRERRQQAVATEPSGLRGTGHPTVGPGETRVSNRQPWAGAWPRGLPFCAGTAPPLLRQYKANCSFSSVVLKTRQMSTRFPTPPESPPHARSHSNVDLQFPHREANDPETDINPMSKVIRRGCRGQS